MQIFEICCLVPTANTEKMMNESQTMEAADVASTTTSEATPAAASVSSWTVESIVNHIKNKGGLDSGREGHTGGG